MRHFQLFAFAVFLCNAATWAAEPPAPGNGQLHETSEGVVVWSDAADQWLDIESFWLEFSASNDGKNWGLRSEYPEYSQLSERDVLLIELAQGRCLMYFWHGRWRRAQDVWRWDEAFNEQLGCPYVFDE